MFPDLELATYPNMPVGPTATDAACNSAVNGDATGRQRLQYSMGITETAVKILCTDLNGGPWAIRTVPPLFVRIKLK